METLTKDNLRKILNGKAILDYQLNPAFISFKLLSYSSAASAVKKLKLNGYDAIRVESHVKINII